MTLPSTMRAIAIAHFGDADSLELQTRPLPSCGDGDILLRVAAAGVNGPDLAQRRGHYHPPPDASPLPGLEVAGQIVGLGKDVTNWRLGDAAMALCNGGGYAEYVAIPAGQALPLPTGWSAVEAAALPETWFTITQTLVMRAGLDVGMTVLVHGAAGGIGGAAIQISTILGARAIGVVSSRDKAKYAAMLGAVATIDYSNEDVAERAIALTEGKGVDRVLDIIGGAMTEHNIRASAQGGHIVQVSTLDGGSTNISLRTMMARQLTLSGSTLRPQTPATKAAIATVIRSRLLPALSQPDFVKPAITRFALTEAAEAHRLMESRSHLGKIVLVTSFGATM